MKLIFIISFLLMVNPCRGESCAWFSASGQFHCSGLNNNSSEYVRSCLEQIPSGTAIGVNFISCNVSGLAADLFAGYLVAQFQCEFCDIDKFPFDAMHSFGYSLRVIYILQSNIGSFTGDQTALLPFRFFLAEIGVYFSTISRIEAQAFKEFPNLYKIEIISNLLHVVDDYAFSNVTKLQYLELYGNRLHSLPRYAITNLPLLSDLLLSINTLQTLETGMLNDEDFPSMANLRLDGNPWICNCSLQWLKDYINDHPDVFIGTNPECAEPKVGYFNLVDFCT